MIYILAFIIATGQGTASIVAEYSSKEACDVARETNRYQAGTTAKVLLATCTAKALTK